MKKLFFALSVIFVLGVSACSSSSDSEESFNFEGRCWQEMNDTSETEDYYMYYSKGVLYDATNVIKYNWWLVDETNCNISGPSSVPGITIEVSGDYCTLKKATGESMKYKAVALPSGFAAKM